MVWIHFSRKSPLIPFSQFFPAVLSPALFQVFGRIQPLIPASSHLCPARGAAISIFIKFLSQDPQSPAHPSPGTGKWSRDGRSGKNAERKTCRIQGPAFPSLFLFCPEPGAAKPSLGVGAGRMGKSKRDFPAPRILCWDPNAAVHGDGSGIHPTGIVTLPPRCFLSQLQLWLLPQ